MTRQDEKQGTPGARRSLAAAVALGSAVLACPAWAQQLPAAGKGADEPLIDLGEWVSFLKGWKGFMDWSPLEILAGVLVSLILAAVIAFHPRTYGKATTLDEFEQPKVFLMYALVGAMVGLICGFSPPMAFVIFGLGGLFRFRTEVGQARDTGRLILVTLVGILCGLMQFVPAVIATAVGWALILLLERTVVHKVTIKGLEQQVLAQAADAYREVLAENGIVLLSEKKNINKKQVAFVIRAPGGLDREELEALFKDIPPKLQGAVDWESS
jgi:hypothetical protein